MKGRKAKLALILLAAAALGLSGFLMFSPWVAQDVCLDAGGAWHEGKCIHLSVGGHGLNQKTGPAANDPIADTKFFRHRSLMGGPKRNPDPLKRPLFGCVGIVALVSAVRDVNAGFFSNHGEAVRLIDHPVVFWLWVAFAGVGGLAALYVAVFGNRSGPR